MSVGVEKIKVLDNLKVVILKKHNDLHHMLSYMK